MSTLKISPTPWCLETLAPHGWVIGDDGNYLLELVYTDEEGRYEKDEAVRQNNLRLAHAAPRLLELLKDAQVRVFMADGSSELYVQIGEIINELED